MEQALTPDAISVHLAYLRRELDDIAAKMATKGDIEDLKRDLAGYATKTEVALIRDDVSRLAVRLEASTVQSTFKRIMQTAVWVAAGIAAIGAMWLTVVELVHWFDRQRVEAKK